MEDAPAAIYCLAAAAREPVWANARARAARHRAGTSCRSSTAARSPTWSTRCSRTGRPRRSAARWATAGPSATVVVRPLRVAGGTGALVVLESDDAATDTSWLAQAAPTSSSRRSLSLLPPSLPMLPDLRLSGQLPPGDVRRGPPAATGTTRCRSGAGGVALVVGDAVGPRRAGRRRDEPAARRHALDRAARPVAARPSSPPSTPSPPRWTTSRAPRSSTASSTPAPATSPTAAAGHPAPAGRATPTAAHVVPAGHAAAAAGQPPGRRDRRCRARARAGRDARAVLQRRAWPGAGSDRPTRCDRLADVARRGARPRPARWTPTASADARRGDRRGGPAARRAGPTTSPCWWPTAGRRPMEPLRLELRRRPRGAARGPPAARRAGSPRSAWASRTGSA